MAVRLIRPINSAFSRNLAVSAPVSSLATIAVPKSRNFFVNDCFASHLSKGPIYQCQRLYSALSPIQQHPPSLYGQLQPISFSIIAHIDHGKSTLADRLLEMTGSIPIGADGQVINKQVLDSLKVERERGITVKSQAVSMIYDDKITKQKWLLNLIDTPGHVDFAYEVSRSLSACQIALLVVDATQGIQSQTLSVFRVAMARGLRIIPVINKIDLPGASPDTVLDQLHERLGLNVLPGESEEAIMVSAKTGKGVEDVLKRLVVVGSESTQDVGDGQNEKMRSLVFDSWYDSYKGVVALISVKDGTIKKGDKIASAHSRKRYEVLDIGVNSPTAIATGILRKGQVGWVICNMKSVPEASIGDTLHHDKVKVDPLPGFKPSVPMIYCSAFPVSSSDFPKLEMAIQKLALNDRSVTWQRESSLALGQVLITNPTVAYRIVRPEEDENEAKVITNPLEFPDDEVMRSKRSTKNGLQIQEPMVIGTLTCPEEYLGAMSQLCFDRRGEEIDMIFQDGFGTNEEGESVIGENTGGERLVIMKYRLPLSEIVTDFFGELKSKTAGFATFDYEDDGWQASDLVRISFLLTGTPLDALSQIVHRSKAVDVAKVWTQKLKEIVPRQQYEVNIQAMVGGRVVSSEKKSAYRKDVTAGLYGGHYERKLKHLNKQKEGKKRLRAMSVGRVQIPQENFMKLFEAK
ncbi:hypothetical protein L7F22_019104 [Adiantum nelumboides]|nr:hypothetical protein [Adiantum nelumboides]